MASFSRVLLSGSTNGGMIPVVAAASPGTLIHTAVAGDGAFDELYLWVSNVTNAVAKLTLEWGGHTDPANLMTKQLQIPAFSAPTPVLLGQVLNGGLVVYAFSNVANALNVSGFVNRIQ